MTTSEVSDVAHVGKLEGVQDYEVCTEFSLLPFGAWLRVDWDDRTLRASRLLLARIPGKGLRLVTVHRAGEEFVMVEANGQWECAEDVQEFGAVREYRLASRFFREIP